MSLQFYKNELPSMGELVSVRITEINQDDGTLKCQLLEYSNIYGLVIRVDGKWRTHKAYKKLKIGDITILSCNDINNSHEVDLSYSTIDQETLINTTNNYKNYLKIVTFLIKVSALINNNKSKNISELMKDNEIITKTQLLINETLHSYPEKNDVIDAFFKNTYDIYKHAEKWSFYNEDIGKLLKKEFHVPIYTTNFDIQIISLYCNGINNIKETLELVYDIIKNKTGEFCVKEPNANISISNNFNIIAGPFYRITIQGFKLDTDLIDNIKDDVLKLANDYLNITIKPIEIVMKNQ